MSVMSALVKRGLRWWTKIFHFTNRGDDGHNRTEFMNPKPLNVASAALIGAANARPAFCTLLA